MTEETKLVLDVLYDNDTSVNVDLMGKSFFFQVDDLLSAYPERKKSSKSGNSGNPFGANGWQTTSTQKKENGQDPNA